MSLISPHFKVEYAGPGGWQPATHSQLNPMSGAAPVAIRSTTHALSLLADTIASNRTHASYQVRVTVWSPTDSALTVSVIWDAMGQHRRRNPISRLALSCGDWHQRLQSLLSWFSAMRGNGGVTLRPLTNRPQERRKP